MPYRFSSLLLLHFVLALPVLAGDNQTTNPFTWSLHENGAHLDAQFKTLTGADWVDLQIRKNQGTNIGYRMQRTEPTVFEYRVPGFADGDRLEVRFVYQDDQVGQRLTDWRSMVFGQGDANSPPARHTIPGRIQAEDYLPGQGIGFVDSDPGNQGGAYRQDDVDIEVSAGDGFNIGWTQPGEWLKYSISAQESGPYTVKFRVASKATGNKTVYLELDGVNVTEMQTFTHEAGWQNYIDVTVPDIQISAGEHELRLVMDSAHINIDYLEFQKQPTEPDHPASPDHPPSEGHLVIQGRQLLLDGQSFEIQGVNWNPVVKGGVHPSGLDYAGWVEVDSDLMKQAGFNVVRTYQPITDTAVLDRLHAAGIYVMNTVYAYGGTAVNEVATVVNQVKDHPAILMWVIGNEWNYNGLYVGLSHAQSMARIQEVINVIRQADNSHPIATIYGELPTQETLAALPGIDVWGVNAYRGISFGHLFDDWASRSEKPLFIGEYGADAYNANIQSVDVESQKIAVTALTNEIFAHSVVTEPTGVTLGGLVFEWADEWWKDQSPGSGGPGVHDTGGMAPGGGPYPDQTFNEEWWGLVDIDRSPRPAYQALASLFRSRRAGGDTPALPDLPDQPGMDPVDLKPLFNENTLLEHPVSYDRGDALVTRFADRARDRHAKEDQFQAYDHYLSHYWKHRTAQFQLVDHVAKGGNKIEITFITEWKLKHPIEFRAWYAGLGSVAQYYGNYGAEGIQEEGPGTWDGDFVKTSDAGHQYKYTLTVDDYRPLNWSASDGRLPLASGQRMEIEVSQFLDGVPEGRSHYYGSVFLYIVGEGLVPWETKGAWEDPSSEREDSYPIDPKGWLGGKTTLPYAYSNEPDNHFMQMATNLSNINGQPFVLGRRVHHTSFLTGEHDESAENGLFAELAGKAGPHYINHSCASCHTRNGRASVADIGVPLDKWVFKVADANGDPDPDRGSILQPNHVGLADQEGEGVVTISGWLEKSGLRSPQFAFSKGAPKRFSARLAPQLVGLGLLEAVSESTLLAYADVDDANGDGISGKPQLVLDPVSHETRLGRFGYKAIRATLREQVAAALNNDMGVMTSLRPTPDCGSSQSFCGQDEGIELAEEALDHLVKYVALLGVRAQRNLDNPKVNRGEALFSQTGCADCHRPTLKTSPYAPFAELRDQRIHPYTDLLLHDMGEGLADNLSEGVATGSEWRTTPLWGVGLSACVTGGLTNPTGKPGDEVCAPDASYLHDGRARTLEEAILWHGGEAQKSNERYQALPKVDQEALLEFLRSL